jgi:hypothetical protein
MPISLEELDDKQCNLIRSWMKRASNPNDDYYGRFISLWIAFNALCYALYASEANRRRADIKKDKGFFDIGDITLEARGSVRSEAGRIRIEITEPGRITLDLVEKYTEDLIFSEFAKGYASEYSTWIEDPAFKQAIQKFRSALRKPDGAHYVINMARIREYMELKQAGNKDSYLRKPLVYQLKDISDLAALKDALYQVRCNIFHGEKVPGEPNDDSIVQTAYPALAAIMNQVTAQLPTH